MTASIPLPIPSPGADPISLNTYIFKLDYKISANGNHSLFVRGNLQNDHESKPPQFPGLPANDFLTNNSKGICRRLHLDRP